MSRIRTLLGAAMVAGALAAPVDADLIPGRPIVIKQNNTLVTVELLSADPDHLDNLYFLGSGDRTHIRIAAPDSDSKALGQFLFNTSTSTPGAVVQLIGTFDAGDKLHFALDIVGEGSDDDVVFQSQKQGFRKQFAYDKQTFIYGVDDTNHHDADFDGDYDDIVVRFTFSNVPSPGAMSLLGLGILVACSRRHRCA